MARWAFNDFPPFRCGENKKLIKDFASFFFTASLAIKMRMKVKPLLLEFPNLIKHLKQ